MNMFRTMRGLGVACALASVSIAAQAAQGITNFSNADPIVIPASNSSGVSSLYPSPIVVSGLRGTVHDVRVTLNGLSHTFSADLDILVVAPNGQQVVLTSDAGSGSDYVDATLTFRSDAATGIPATNPIPSGSYLPSDPSPGDTYPSAPAGTRSANLAGFNGDAAAQNGTWRLYVFDDAAADIGQIARGWTLSITSDVFTTCAAEGYAGSKLTLCQKVCESNASGSTLTGLIRLYVAAYREQPACAL